MMNEEMMMQDGRGGNTHLLDETHYGLIQQQNTEQVKYILNADDVIAAIEIFLRGYVPFINADGEEIYGPDPTGRRKPLLNDNGVNSLLRILNLRLSRVFTLSNFELQTICIICKQFGRNIIKELYAKQIEYEVAKIDIPLIAHEMSDAVFATMLKAKNGNLQGFLKDTSRYSETKSVNGGKGFMSNPFSRIMK